ncbi:MAG: hypothetical protein EHM28_12380, partial [Spirochaetaceae bacterium]
MHTGIELARIRSNMYLEEGYFQVRSKKMRTYAYGFPRIGKKREYKKALESFWAGKSDETAL